MYLYLRINDDVYTFPGAFRFAESHLKIGKFKRIKTRQVRLELQHIPPCCVNVYPPNPTTMSNENLIRIASSVKAAINAFCSIPVMR